jgi:hypothetical protein
MKTCFKCGKKKKITDFYKHPRTFDGRLGKCKDCTKKDVRLRSAEKSKDPEYVAQERVRGRKKYYRLYRTCLKPITQTKRSRVEYRKQYPEKHIAGSLSQHIARAKGTHNHHWSYNMEHVKDIINMEISDHYKLHRYMTYDQERMMYRNLDGVLLDSKETHLEYFESIKSRP